MPSFKFAIGQVNITDYLLVVARKSTSPTSEAARQSFAGPQPTSRNIEFDNLDAAVYYFDFRESTDGVDLGTLMGTYTVDVKENTILSEKRFYLTGGVRAIDPAPGADAVIDPYLDGKTVVGVFIEGFRFLVSPDYTFAEFELVSGGGVHRTDGKVFSIDEVVMIELNYVNTSSTTNNASFPTDFILKTADFTFDSTYYNSMIEANKTGTVLKITMPAIASLPDGTKFGINTHNISQRYVNLQFLSGEYCLVGGNQRNAVFIGRGEEAVFQKKGSYIRVVSWTGDWRRVGEKVEQDLAPINGIQEAGGWQLFDDIARLFYWYVNALPLGQLGTATYPATPDAANKTKWIIDGVNGRFWVPDTQGMFDKATNGGNPGVFEDQSVQNHRHFSFIDKQTNSGTFPHDRGTALTAARSPIRYWEKSGAGAEGYEIDSNVDEPTIGRTGLPTDPSGTLINSTLTQPKSVYRNFYRIT